MRRIFIIVASVLIASLVVAGAIFWFLKSQKYGKEPVPPAVEITQIFETQETVESMEEIEKKPTEPPQELNLKIPFYSQAPFGNWDYPWQEACEEASVLLVANVYHNKNWTREEFNEEILKLVEWEKERFGYYEHTDMTQTAQILKEHFNLETKFHKSPTYQEIQKILSKGHLIILPVAGQKIGNPFYTNGGPVYHVMIIKGYKDGEKIITHDVGTKRGEDYVYSWETIANALHDYAEPIENGERVILEVIPPTPANY